ncbi:Biotin carboxylase [Actinopolyspora mzabensis]|uniref:Biotin carboxylase n=1 Tax=Actinopolyspora mzabensis TaxID=995066 RepID=A0A1G9A3J0_ACTMZ|nr:ATP-grasp domain-containing protein [Actinopolyspora mzabensis]SDK20970.1 Biotin carboxylase [Actinopolyspora mzabensis]
MQQPSRNDRVVVFVESPLTGAGTDAARLLAAEGVETVVLVAAPERLPEYLVRQYGEAGAELRRCDTADTAAVLAECRRIAATGKLLAVTSLYEYYTVRGAEVAAELGLPGPAPAAVRNCRSKSAMRHALDGVANLNPAFGICETVGEAVATASDIGFPVVVKPTGLTGSVYVRRCDTPEEVQRISRTILELDEYLRIPVDPQVAVEEHVAGPEFSAEVFDGEVLGLTEKRCGPPPNFIEMGHLFPADAPEHVRRLVTETARHAVSTLGLDWGAAHVEVRLTSSGDDARVIEVNSRLAGDRIPELVRLARGIDMTGLQVDALLGRPRHARPDRDQYAAVAFQLAPESGRLTAVEGIRQVEQLPGVVEVHHRIGIGQVHQANGSNQDRAAWVIAVGDSGHQAISRAEAAARELRLAWDPADTVTQYV